MNIYIATSNPKKEVELSKYFKNIGLKTITIPIENIPILLEDKKDFMCVREQTQLVSKSDGKKSLLDKFEEVVHYSKITLMICKDKKVQTKYFDASVEGLIFPSLKTTRPDIYNWDDIFVSVKTMKTYQEMKDNGIKNSARDIAFSKMIDELPEMFKFDSKVNLNYNPVSYDEVISFEPFIKQLFDNNEYFSIVYKNDFFKTLVDKILLDGLFIRRASDRKQKNYWLPGLNAGIPLTPKKDALHELTFMFHDIMHFLYPDLVVTKDNKENKHKYIISRMMSEAFTLVLADMLFISILKNNNVDYDYNKRKIHPLFENIAFDISFDNLPKLKKLLWANVCFAVLGEDEPLKTLVKNDDAFEAYKEKYQRFFQEDYRWTSNNYLNISKDALKNTKWLEVIYSVSDKIVPNSNDFAPLFNINCSLKEQVESIFEVMFDKIKKLDDEKIEYNEDSARTNAIRRYMSGQLAIFFRFETLYNSLFVEQITLILKKEILTTTDLDNMRDLYNVYINKLMEDNYITKYESNSFKNIYPIFNPFYVFYEQQKIETFKETMTSILKEVGNV